MLLIFHPFASKDVRKIESDYSRISEQLADRFWAELNEAIDKVFSHPARQHFDPSQVPRKTVEAYYRYRD